MRFQRVTPMLWTNDFPGTLDFYTQRLGFVTETLDENSWASLARDSVRVMISKPNDHLPFAAPNFTGTLYFFVSDVEELWASIKDSHQICYPMEDFAYGMREFAIYDNNGYILQFGTSLS
jgi:uncharacterized glyoxalase superfamily protein PhnB